MSQDLDSPALATRLATGDALILLDVREPWEFETAALPNAVLVPLSTLTQRALNMDPAAEYVVYCHHGGRSAMAVQWMRGQGFSNVANLEGGIDGWSLDVDATVPRY